MKFVQMMEQFTEKVMDYLFLGTHTAIETTATYIASHTTILSSSQLEQVLFAGLILFVLWAALLGALDFMRVLTNFIYYFYFNNNTTKRTPTMIGRQAMPSSAKNTNNVFSGTSFSPKKTKIKS